MTLVIFFGRTVNEHTSRRRRQVMDTATQVLRNEHRNLTKCLHSTESVAAQIRRGEVVQPGVLGQAIECFRVFLDDCLLSKEEDLLFPILERKGVSQQSSPLSLMLVQHETARRLLKEMGKAAAEYEAGHSEAGRRWAVAGLDFVDLMRNHLRRAFLSLWQEGSARSMKGLWSRKGYHPETAAIKILLPQLRKKRGYQSAREMARS